MLSKTTVVLVGIGNAEAASKFAEDLNLLDGKGELSKLVLVADESGVVSDALGCYKGWLAIDNKHRER